MQNKHIAHFKICFSFLSKVKSDSEAEWVMNLYRHKVQTNYASCFFFQSFTEKHKYHSNNILQGAQPVLLYNTMLQFISPSVLWGIVLQNLDWVFAEGEKKPMKSLS